MYQLTSIFLVVCCISIAGRSFGQDTETFRDTANHYEVSYPKSWHLEHPFKDAYFLVYRPILFEGEQRIENAVFCRVYDGVTNLETAYTAALNYNKARESDFQLESEGTAKDGRYKWYVETHKNVKADEVIKMLVAVYYRDNYPIVLKCTASPRTFEGYKETFFKLADSIRMME